MHQPRPHGTFGAEAATEEDAAAAELLARRVTNFKTVSGLDSFKMTRTLPSGAIAIAVDMGGVFRVIIQPRPQQAPTEETDGLAKTYIPMLFCGVINSGVIRPGDGVRIKLTSETRRRLVSYSPGDQQPLPPQSVSLQRFVIEHNGRVSELRPKEPTAYITTQYSNQRPTWYSGAMAEVMQIVGGYGRQTLKDLPDNKIERARLMLPAKVAKKIEAELGNTRLPGYLGLPPKSGEFQYDYKYNATNGVGFDGQGKPWLLQVSTRGVYAMPLPTIPATTTKAFRDFVDAVGDDEIKWIINRFGGMPSGESFPLQEKDFESWRRAGVIVKVCDAGDFYNHLAYTSAIGWSFNSKGSEGFNTCYDYEEGIGFGMSFKLRMGLGAAQNDGKLPVAFDLEDPEDMQRLNSYLSMLYRQLPDNTARALAIKYKLRRVPVSDVLGRANNSGPGEVDYWDNLEVAPIADHSGSITEVGRGRLWHGASPQLQPQIKFPEPFMDGCVSHDFGRLEGFPMPTDARCDTAMFGYYVGDALKVAKYFYDPRGFTRKVEDNYEDCMIVGSWEQTVTEGSTTLLGHFYTSDFDEREAAAPVTTVTTIVGTDLGYDTKPHFSFDFIFSTSGTMWRNRYFQHKTKETKTEGFGKSVALCVPYLARNAVLHADKEFTTGATESENLAVHAAGDPNTYRYYTYDQVLAWMGTAANGNMETIPVTADRLAPYPRDGNPVWVVARNYFPQECSDFADSGDWVGGLPADYTWLIHPVRSEWLHSGGGGPPTVREYSRMNAKDGSEKGLLQISIQQQSERVHTEPSSGYFTFSPVNDSAFYVDAIRNVAGDATYASTSEIDPESRQRKRWGYTALADHSTPHHFIGVIHG